MPNRTISSNEYRYGFNGKENDSNGEWGDQLIQDYGFRLYNPAIGKFLSVDPLTPSYPMYTPYQFSANNPISFIDVDGLEAMDPPEYKYKGNVIVVFEAHKVDALLSDSHKNENWDVIYAKSLVSAQNQLKDYLKHSKIKNFAIKSHGSVASMALVKSNTGLIRSNDPQEQGRHTSISIYDLNGYKQARDATLFSTTKIGFPSQDELLLSVEGTSTKGASGAYARDAVIYENITALMEMIGGLEADADVFLLGCNVANSDWAEQVAHLIYVTTGRKDITLHANRDRNVGVTNINIVKGGKVIGTVKKIYDYPQGHTNFYEFGYVKITIELDGKKPKVVVTPYDERTSPQLNTSGNPVTEVPVDKKAEKNE